MTRIKGERKLEIHVSPEVYDEMSALGAKSNRSIADIFNLGLGLARLYLEARDIGHRVAIIDDDDEELSEITTIWETKRACWDASGPYLPADKPLR